jgi:Mrp family chromosome partitioning ATPase
VRPEPAQAAFVAVLAGLIGGVLLAFLREALDTRARSTREVRERLAAPVLGRLPAAGRGRRRAALMDEAAWSLRTSVELANAELGARVIMVTGSAPSAGASTVAVHLGRALARGGRRVALVDLDLSHRSIGSDLGRRDDDPGVADVLAGDVALDQAFVPIEDADGPGSLVVLPPGRAGQGRSAVLHGRVIAGRLLEDVRERADIVLVHAPALVGSGEAMALTATVDALLVVVRLGATRRAALTELRRNLDASPAPVLGVAVTGASAGETSLAPDLPAARRRPKAVPA